MKQHRQKANRRGSNAGEDYLKICGQIRNWPFSVSFSIYLWSRRLILTYSHLCHRCEPQKAYILKKHSCKKVTDFSSTGHWSFENDDSFSTVNPLTDHFLITSTWLWRLQNSKNAHKEFPEYQAFSDHWAPQPSAPRGASHHRGEPLSAAWDASINRGCSRGWFVMFVRYVWLSHSSSAVLEISGWSICVFKPVQSLRMQAGNDSTPKVWRSVRSQKGHNSYQEVHLVNNQNQKVHSLSPIKNHYITNHYWPQITNMHKWNHHTSTVRSVKKLS